jgi:hypothetical protein
MAPIMIHQGSVGTVGKSVWRVHLQPPTAIGARLALFGAGGRNRGAVMVST